ncbi:hypothetical protein DPMN_137575 [Dreissena polymorpha]|uniref:Uncharacterized protein n=1 Tax=Dreissena polymorpha TaxID=45954 RepID=A0A9D4G226_DREPO|nr:hypothetical protein DPMN_137575 [Dreissena polymorpha]
MYRFQSLTLDWPMSTYKLVQYSQRGTNIILGHAKARIVSTRQPRRVFTRRIAEAHGIDPRKDAESILTSCTFAELIRHVSSWRTV